MEKAPLDNPRHKPFQEDQRGGRRFQNVHDEIQLIPFWERLRQLRKQTARDRAEMTKTVSAVPVCSHVEYLPDVFPISSQLCHLERELGFWQLLLESLIQRPDNSRQEGLQGRVTHAVCQGNCTNHKTRITCCSRPPQRARQDETQQLVSLLVVLSIISK